MPVRRVVPVTEGSTEQGIGHVGENIVSESKGPETVNLGRT